MITGELRNKIDALWDVFAAGGLVNPLEVIEQITYLMFIHDLDDTDNRRAKESEMLGLPFESIFKEEVKIGDRVIDGKQLKWSVFHDYPADRMYSVMQEFIFPFIKNLHGDKDSAYSKYMDDAIFKLPTPLLLSKVVDSLDEIYQLMSETQSSDVRGDVYEYLLSKIAQSGRNGQFRTPRHIIRMMVELVDPKPADIICDPAAGSGNFLTESYLSLRRLENRVLQELYNGQITFVDSSQNPIGVSIGQFYGIEINDFAVTVARTALWIAENQMLQETESILLMHIDFLPLKSYPNIREGNALKIDWNDIISPERVKYIIGNSPFIGSYRLSESQKEDRESIFGKDGGLLDYVACWYKKAAAYIKGYPIRCAFVSTNSICQGPQVTPLWKPLFDEGLYINFAYQYFRWGSESSSQAHVFCVIIGFSMTNIRPCVLYSTNNEGKQYVRQEVDCINGYLQAADRIFIEKSSKPLCDVPEMAQGFKPADNGCLLLSKEEYEAMIAKEPGAEKWIRRFSMGQEFVNGIDRYCLWLKGISPAELNSLPLIKERVKACGEWRAAQTKSGDAYKLKDTPHLLRPCNKFKDGAYIGIPKVTSGRRSYVPFGFITDGTIPGDKLYFIPSDSLLLFGILISNVHMAWMRMVAGRLKGDYSYSNTIVYNCFPMPHPTESQEKAIESSAQAIHDARKLYPDSTLAELYDPDFMPPELKKAHISNDRAVLDAYGFKGTPAYSSETACVAELMKMYQELV